MDVRQQSWKNNLPEDGVLLYSSGLDSFCIGSLFPKLNKIFIITGTQDNEQEYNWVRQRNEKINWINMRFLSSFEMDNKIIPFRNAFLTLIGAMYHNNIWMGFTTGDTTKDKDHVFMSLMETFLNYFGQDKNKVLHDQYPFHIIAPFISFTKTNIVRIYLEEGHDPHRLISHSRSCYHHEEKECGVCRSCLRKWVALYNNHLESLHQFATEPTTDHINSLLFSSQQKGRSPQELGEIQNCLDEMTWYEEHSDNGFRRRTWEEKE